MELKNKIMIIDDNIIDQMVTHQVLKTSYAQNEVLIMDGSLQALQYLKANEMNADSLPSVIILDLDMPEMNGFGFLAGFSNYPDHLKKAIKIVVLTATDKMEDVELLKTNPMVTKIIFKPLYQSALAEVL